MDYFPAFLDLKDRACLIVGGGPVALRKARLLNSAGARLTIVAPETCTDLRDFALQNGHTIVQRRYRPSDTKGRWLVISATGDADVEQAVFRDASDAGVFCNSVDDIENCSYITPAIVDRSPVVVAISSGGAAPVLARKLRAEIETLLPAGISALASLARDWRDRVGMRIGDLLGRRRLLGVGFRRTGRQHGNRGRPCRREGEMRELMHHPAPRQHGEAWLVGAGPGDPGSAHNPCTANPADCRCHPARPAGLRRSAGTRAARCRPDLCGQDSRLSLEFTAGDKRAPGQPREFGQTRLPPKGRRSVSSSGAAGRRLKPSGAPACAIRSFPALPRPPVVPPTPGFRSRIATCRNP